MGHEIERIAGDARLHLKIKDGQVEDVKIDIFESSRYFENFLMGKMVENVPFLVSRICGVCDTAHILGSIKAIENAIQVEVSEQTEKLRELLCFGGIIYSHTLHLFFMVLPDLLGLNNIMEISAKQKKYLKIGLELMELSKLMVKCIGGRVTHAITPTLGGFSKLPTQRELEKLQKSLKRNEKNAISTLELFSSFDKDLIFKKKSRYLALKKYGFLKGDVGSDDGFEFRASEYNKYLEEYKVPYSTSKFVKFRDESFMVGALARLNVNRAFLPAEIRELIRTELPCYSPFFNNVAQAVEIFFLIKKAEEILEKLKIKSEVPKVKIKDGEGISATEAPRGTLYHHYVIQDGKVKYANIITPTAQNLRNMEESIRAFLPFINTASKEKVRNFVERLIRAYDPCISCATHFLKIKYL